MQSPTLSRLQSLLGMSAADARQVKSLCVARDDRDRLEALIEASHPATAAYARSCHSSPYLSSIWRTTMVLDACDRLLGTTGVESMGAEDRAPYAPRFEYLNTGDSYALTLVYDRDRDALIISSLDAVSSRLDSAEL